MWTIKLDQKWNLQSKINSNSSKNQQCHNNKPNLGVMEEGINNRLKCCVLQHQWRKWRKVNKVKLQELDQPSKMQCLGSFQIKVKQCLNSNKCSSSHKTSSLDRITFNKDHSHNNKWECLNNKWFKEGRNCSKRSQNNKSNSFKTLEKIIWWIFAWSKMKCWKNRMKIVLKMMLNKF